VVAPNGVFQCLSANLALQKFFQATNFRFTQTTKRLQPVTTTRIFPPRAIKYHKIHEYLRGKMPTVSLFFTTFMANSLDEVFSLLRVSRHIYSSSIPKQLLISVYAHTMARPGSGPDSSQHSKFSLFVFFNAEGISTLWRFSQ